VKTEPFQLLLILVLVLGFIPYTLQGPERRIQFDAPKPTAVWWNRL
jgi:hypothetical protein